MLIKIGYNIALKFAFPTAVIHLLHVHPSRSSDLTEPERFGTYPRWMGLASAAILPISRLPCAAA
jgi:hypothetical protein